METIRCANEGVGPKWAIYMAHIIIERGEANGVSWKAEL